ncbi:hypothetical protein [Bradyrhizobium sp. RP6]|uniref:hypothetical protein n=1 Tax=Bradyrhizobium sp. RP6 TaxID=2489596 RepID=UPI0013152D7D|nr:hypothetical protein [Bradyrhizobium sp. RP6]
MDTQNFNRFNVPASSQVQQEVSEAPQTDEAVQFEQHLAEASQAASVAIRRPNDYPHLTEEDRNLIDTVIARYAAQQNLQPNTAKGYTQALRRLVNDLRRGGQTIDFTDHKSLLDHANTHFPKIARMRHALGVLRAYYAANDNAAHSRAAKRPRTLNDLEEVVVYGQPSANAASGGSSAAPQVASTGVIIGGQSGGRPPYSEDAAAVRGLMQALIQGGMTYNWARYLGSVLGGFSRWLSENNRPSIVARLDSKSLSADGAIQMYPRGSDANLLKALDYFHTFWTTGVVVPAKRRPPRANLNPPPQNVPLINPETVALMEPLRIDDAGAQHSASQQANTRLEELQEEQDGQHAPPAFIQEQTAFQSEQLPQGELRRVLDHLDDQAMPSPVSAEELQRMEEQLHDELHGLGRNQPALSFSIDPEDLTFDLDQFPPGELPRLLYDESAEELQEWRDDHSAPSTFIQARAAFDSKQIPEGELRRVLDHPDDEAMPSAVSDPSEELLRLEKQLHDELQGRRDDQPAPSFSIDPEDLTFDLDQFPPGELRRLVHDEPAEELQEWRDDHPPV